jgi:hypothetical protein
MATDHVHIKDRRKPTTDETIQLWLNILTAAATAVPMILTDLKGMLPEHYYGVLGSAALLINAAIDLYRRTRYGKEIVVPVDHA